MLLLALRANIDVSSGQVRSCLGPQMQRLRVVAALADLAFARMCSGTHFAAQRISRERLLRGSNSGCASRSKSSLCSSHLSALNNFSRVTGFSINRVMFGTLRAPDDLPDIMSVCVLGAIS